MRAGGWDDLVAAAVLGTARRRPEPTVPAALGAPLGAAVATADPEAGLLAAAAATALYRTAGRAWDVAGDPAPSPAPAEDRGLVGPAAAARLAGLLAVRDRDLLPQWLAAAAAAERIVAPVLLPALLDLATSWTDLRPAVRAVGGRRGGWLAAQRAGWAWAFPAEDPAAWTHADRTVRRRHLKARRAGDPAAGRALLAGSWAREDAEARATLLPGLAVGLGPDDEPFLESALDDRRKPVRAAAAELLAGLPGSALAGRVAARLAPLVRAAPGDGIAVDLPAGCPPEWERDGIDPRPPRGTGVRSWWLTQLVGAAPLDWWEQHLGRTPATLAGPATSPAGTAAAAATATRGGPAAAAPTVPAPVRAGWERAAVRQRDVVWADALVPGAEDPAPLLAVLLPATRERHQQAAAAAPRPLAAVLAQLEADAGPWSAEVSTRVLDRVIRIAAAIDPTGRRHPDEVTLRGAIPRLGVRLHPDLAGTAAARLGMLLAPGGPWARSLTGLVETLATRRTLLEELT